MYYLAIIAVGLLWSLIYYGSRTLKRPVTSERSTELAAKSVVGIIVLVPVALSLALFTFGLLIVPPLVALAWMFHPAWVPTEFVEGQPIFLGVPFVVWFGGGELAIIFIILRSRLRRIIRDR